MVRTKFLVIFLLVQKKQLHLMPMENEFKNIDLQTYPANIVLANLNLIVCRRESYSVCGIACKNTEKLCFNYGVSFEIQVSL